MFQHFKRKILMALLAFMSLGFLGTSAGHAVQETTGHLSANFEIIGGGPDIVNATELDFGQVRSGAELDGTVILSPDEVRTATGGAGLSGDNFSPAIVSVSGLTDAQYNIAFTPEAQMSFHDGSITHFLTATNFLSLSDTLVVGGDDTSGMGLIDSTGNDTIRIGGELFIPAGAIQGNYTGFVNIEVMY